MFGTPEPVTVQSPGRTVDRYNNETDEWLEPTERAEACGVAPGGSTEPLEDARAAIESDYDLIFDHDPGIAATDRVVVRGLVCTVDGRPSVWRSPFTGWAPGVVVRVSIKEG